MSSRRSLRADDVEGFIRAWHDEMRDTEALYKVRLEFTLRKGPGRGLLVIHGEAFDNTPAGHQQLVATAERTYPSPRVYAMHAALYQTAMSLNVAVQKWHHGLRDQYYSSPVD